MTDIMLTDDDMHTAGERAEKNAMAINPQEVVAVGRKRNALVMPQSWDSSFMQQFDSARMNKRNKRSDMSRQNNIAAVQSEIDSFVAAAPETLEVRLDVQLRDIVSKQSFQQMLEVMDVKNHHKPSIPEVSRAYEEEYMRSCKRSEYPCVMGSKCECMFIDTEQAFVGTQFVYPTLHTENNMCILCLRKITQLLFYKIIQKGIPSTIPIQKHGNICNKAGEYHPQAMLICPPSGPLHCLPLPIVAHQRNRYTVHDVHGMKYIKQHGVGMEDFHMPLSQMKV